MNLEEMKICANTVNGLINFEMDLHIKLCKRYGISKKNLIIGAVLISVLSLMGYKLYDKGYLNDFLKNNINYYE